MRTSSIHIYQFNELADYAKKKAVTKFREGYDPQWYHEWPTENLKDVCKHLGIDVKDTEFTGFWSQGDGASFTGSFVCKYTNDSDADKFLQGFIAEFGENNPYIDEARQWVVALRGTKFTQVDGVITRNTCRYSHENSVNIALDFNTTHEANGQIYIDDLEPVQLAAYITDCSETQREVSKILRDIMRVYYRELEKAYDDETSEESVRELLEEDTDQEYFEDGARTISVDNM